MSRNFPAEENVFHARSLADVVHDHVLAFASLLIDQDADVRNISTQIPGHEIAGVVVRCVPTGGQNFPMALKEDPQIRDAALVDVGIRAPQ